MAIKSTKKANSAVVNQTRIMSGICKNVEKSRSSRHSTIDETPCRNPDPAAIEIGASTNRVADSNSLSGISRTIEIIGADVIQIVATPIAYLLMVIDRVEL
jgi:hypothetical protein